MTRKQLNKTQQRKAYVSRRIKKIEESVDNRLQSTKDLSECASDLWLKGYRGYTKGSLVRRMKSLQRDAYLKEKHLLETTSLGDLIK